MPDKTGRMDTSGPNMTAVENMHKLLLDALRHREQEMIRYLAILGPALGGFIWLLHSSGGVFVIGTVGVLLLLLLGAVYSLALGYNYRYITLQIAKLEALLEIRGYMLEGWPKSPDDFLKRYKALCTPPEVIKVFWWAFLVGIAGVTLSACLFRAEALVMSIAIPLGVTCLIIGGLLLPWHFGKKLRELCKQEPEKWISNPDNNSAKDNDGEQKQ